MAKRLNIAVLLSGGGTTLKNLILWREAQRLNADIGLVISSRPQAGGLRIAAEAGIKTEIVPSSQYLDLSGREGERIYDWHRMSETLNSILVPGRFDLICMAGFLSRYFLPHSLFGKVINIHPALIPMFCGQDMYGHHVHQAVIDAGVKVSGCTVHFVDNNYDSGPIILQRVCPVYNSDTPDTVARRVFTEECVAYPTAINLIADGRVRLASPTRAVIEQDEDIDRY
ncbi:MAG: phosphoribosylglycinamide formyltransferase [Planctomycetes bacterium]|nr:phosphoribosylglycinamide formyltransferase [Planctomycetota bacterium]